MTSPDAADKQDDLSVLDGIVHAHNCLYECLEASSDIIEFLDAFQETKPFENGYPGRDDTPETWTPQWSSLALERAEQLHYKLKELEKKVELADSAISGVDEWLTRAWLHLSSDRKRRSKLFCSRRFGKFTNYHSFVLTAYLSALSDNIEYTIEQRLENEWWSRYVPTADDVQRRIYAIAPALLSICRDAEGVLDVNKVEQIVARARLESVVAAQMYEQSPRSDARHQGDPFFSESTLRISPQPNPGVARKVGRPKNPERDALIAADAASGMYKSLEEVGERWKITGSAVSKACIRHARKRPKRESREFIPPPAFLPQADKKKSRGSRGTA